MGSNNFIFVLVLAVLIVAVLGQNRFSSRRCPNGFRGRGMCSGWDRNSCRRYPGTYCHAPADAGVCCRRRPQPSRPCRDGSRGLGRCNHRDRYSCEDYPGTTCYSPTDGVGVCCRRRTSPPVGRCPIPSRRPCVGYPTGRRCRSDRSCRRGQLCCQDPCGRVCKYPVLYSSG